MINQEQILSKLTKVKINIRDLWAKYSENDFALTKERMNKITGNVSSKVGQGKDIIKQRLDSSKKAPLSKDSNLISASEIEDVAADNILDAEEADSLISNSRGKRKKDGVKYYETENSELSVGAEKVTGGGIDSFGEEDTFDPERSR